MGFGTTDPRGWIQSRQILAGGGARRRRSGRGLRYFRSGTLLSEKYGGNRAAACRRFVHRPTPETITVVLPPPSPARNAQAVANLSARAVEFFAHRFGPYPYASLALTQMPGDVSQGWPSLIFLSSFSFLTPQEKSRAAHESLGQESER